MTLAAADFRFLPGSGHKALSGKLRLAAPAVSAVLPASNAPKERTIGISICHQLIAPDRCP